MRHVVPLLIKSFASFTAFWLAFRMTGDADITTPTVATLLFVPLGYLIGDLGVLARAGNTSAVAVDAVLAVGAIWASARWLTQAVAWPALAAAAVSIGAVEFFQHTFLLREGVVEVGRPRRRIDDDRAEKVRDDEETGWF
ncbi:MAG TPA: DUF2512 family protein [Bacillota bacterium]